MYQGYVYSSNPQLSSLQQHLYGYGYPPGSLNPLTPLDLSYSHSMLPANLLSSSPSPYVTRQFFLLQPPLPLHLYHPRLQQVHGLVHKGLPLPYQNQPMPGLPYLTHPTTNPNWDQLNLSRTVILRHLRAEITLNELLTEIDHGPIEYCKMFSTPAPSHLKDVDTVKTCYISFVNTKLSVGFHHKYGKNAYNLRALREKLNSKYLKITLNELTLSASSTSSSNNLRKQDFIKLKTLNYILDFNATRSVLVKFSLAEPELVPTMKEEFQTLCARYGEIEDFRMSTNDEKKEIKFLVHFTSIDAAIKVYEYNLKRIQIDLQTLLDLEGDQVMQGMCVSVNFHRDRCDRTDVNKNSLTRLPQNNSMTKGASSSSSSSVNSSPHSSRKGLNSHFQDIPESDEIVNGEGVADCSSPIATGIVRDEQVLSPTVDPDAVVDKLGYCEPSGTPIAAQTKDSPSLGSGSLDDLHSVCTSNVPSEPPLTSRHGEYSRHIRGSDTYPYSQTSQYPMRGPPSQMGNYSVSSMPSFQHNPEPFNVGNRTIYLGNLHPNTTVEEISNNVRAGGLVECLKFFKAKRLCFITFVDPAIALKFFLNHQVLHQLIIHGNDVNVNWGKNHSGPLNREIALAVTAGASRNVYIGIKPSKEGTTDEPKMQLPDEETLRADFSKFGELEQINFYHNKDCGFINFMNIMNAIKLVDMFESQNAEKLTDVAGDSGEFYEKYKNFKISFGKDRCGNPPKFSFKKKNKSFDYLRDRDISQEELFRAQESNILPDEFSDSINEEAAMVFGISTDPVTKDYNSYVPAEVSEDASTSPESLAESTSILDDVGKLQEQNGEEVETKNVEISADEDGNEDEKEDDDEDDISIIIGSDITTSSQNRHSRNKSNRRPQRPSHNRPELYVGFPLHFSSSRNSSTLSLNSNNAKYYNYHHAKFNPVPSIAQNVYYQQTAPPHAQIRANSYYGVSPQMAGVPPPFVHHHSYPFPQTSYQNKGHYSLSGSQVMAQYLAKSQHDNFVYASSIYSNEVTPEEVRNFKKSSSHLRGKQNS